MQPGTGCSRGHDQETRLEIDLVFLDRLAKPQPVCRDLIATVRAENWGRAARVSEEAFGDSLDHRFADRLRCGESGWAEEGEERILDIGKRHAQAEGLVVSGGAAKAEALDDLAGCELAVDLGWAQRGQKLHHSLVDSGRLERAAADGNKLDPQGPLLHSGEPDGGVERPEGGLLGRGFRPLALPQLLHLVLSQLELKLLLLDALDGQERRNGSPKRCNLAPVWDGQAEAIAVDPGAIPILREQLPADGVLLGFRFRGEIEREIGDQETRLLVGYVERFLGPDDRVGVACEALSEAILDRGTKCRVVALHLGDGIIDQLGNVRVFLEAVADTIVMEIEAGLPQIAEDGGCRDVVQIGRHANVEKLGLGHTRGKRIADSDPLATETAEGIHQDCRGDPGGRPNIGEGRGFTAYSLVDLAGPRILSQDVGREGLVEVVSGTEFLENGQANLGMLQRDLARTQQDAGLRMLLQDVQAGGQQAERAAGALKVLNGSPALAHQVDEGGVERVAGAEPLKEPVALLVGHMLLALVGGIGAPHLGEDGLVDLSDLGRRGWVGSCPEQPAMKDGQDLVAGNGLTELVDAVGQHVELLEESDIPQRLFLAPLERIDHHGPFAARDLNRQALEEVLGLALER